MESWYCPSILWQRIFCWRSKIKPKTFWKLKTAHFLETSVHIVLKIAYYFTDSFISKRCYHCTLYDEWLFINNREISTKFSNFVAYIRKCSFIRLYSNSCQKKREINRIIPIKTSSAPHDHIHRRRIYQFLPSNGLLLQKDWEDDNKINSISLKIK